MLILNTIQPFYSKTRWILFPSHNSKSPVWILKPIHILEKHSIMFVSNNKYNYK